MEEQKHNQTQNGLEWLTIPIKQSGKFGQKINESKVLNNIWRKKHWKSLTQNYNKAPFFEQLEKILKPLYMESEPSEYLSEINLSFIKIINGFLNIDTEIINSKNLILKGDKNERILNICNQLNVDKYISGPAAKKYFDEELFKRSGINVSFLNYNDYPEYNQLFGKFEHNVSILDLLFNKGKEAKFYMKSFINAN